MKLQTLSRLLSICTLFLFTLLVSVFVRATTVYDQLCELNKYWDVNEVASDILCEELEFSSHTDLIQLHLHLVEKTLRAKNTDHLTPSQKASREEGLDILNNYWQQKQFPINTRHSYQRPYFIDDYNTACAVGHIMRESGAVDLAHHIAEQDNYAYLEDMNFPEVGEWALAMGFEVEELKWIQPAYGPSIVIQPEPTHPTCGNNDGAIDITVSAGWGSPPILIYSAVWESISSNTPTFLSMDEDIYDVQAGIYKVEVTSFDINPYSERLYIPLNDAGAADLTYEIINESCPGQYDGAINIEVIGGTAPFEFKWFDHNGELISTSEDVTDVKGIEFPVFFPSLSIPHSHHVEVTDANGCKSYGLFSVYRDSPGVEFYEYPGDVQHSCEQLNNGSISLEHVFGTAPMTYEWTDGSTADHRTDLAPGIYEVLVTDANGCFLDIAFEVEEVNDLHIVQENISCENGDVYDLTVHIYGGNASFFTDGYTVTAGDFEVITEWFDQYIILNVPAGEEIVLDITDTNGCTYTKTVNNHETAELFENESETYCNSIYLFAPVEGMGWLWSNGETSSSIYVTESGTYGLEVQLEGGCVMSDEIEIVLNSIDAGFSYDLNGLSVQFENTTVNGDTYFWQFSDGQTSTEENPYITFAEPGIYTAFLTADNSTLECPASGVSQEFEVFSTGIGDPVMLPFTLYPNPSAGQIVVSRRIGEEGRSGAADMAIFDVSGKAVYSQALSGFAESIDVSHLTAGMYIVQLRSGESVGVRKLVIRN